MREVQKGNFTTPTRNNPKRPSAIYQNESLDEHRGKRLLADYGIPVTREGTAKTKTEAFLRAREIGFPIAIKILSPDILHKTEQGGVVLSIQNEAELDLAVDQLEARFPALRDSNKVERLLIQEMVLSGVEVFLGMTNDPHFGPLLVLGLGGIFVEVLKDVAFAKPPVTALQAEQLWRSLRGSAILDGVRGRPPADLRALVQTTVDFSYLIEDLAQDFEGIDINPLMVLPDKEGVKALDALFVSRH